MEGIMRKKTLVTLITLFSFLALIGMAYAQATPDDAKAMVQKAKEFYQAQGKDKAMAAFKDPKGEFVKGDLYIYVLDMNGKMLTHPKADLVGKDFMVVKDKDGKLFAVDMVKMAKEKGSGWVDYKWENPTTKAVDPKTVYFEKVDDVILAAGAYKK
jgi:cytochrome c